MSVDCYRLNFSGLMSSVEPLNTVAQGLGVTVLGAAAPPRLCRGAALRARVYTQHRGAATASCTGALSRVSGSVGTLQPLFDCRGHVLVLQLLAGRHADVQLRGPRAGGGAAGAAAGRAALGGVADGRRAHGAPHQAWDSRRAEVRTTHDTLMSSCGGALLHT